MELLVIIVGVALLLWWVNHEQHKGLSYHDTGSARPEVERPHEPAGSPDEELALYLAGSIRGGRRWHYCYRKGIGSWKSDDICTHA